MASVIEGVVFYYLDGAKLEKYKWNTRFRCSITPDLSLSKLKNHLCEFAGFRTVAKEQGLGDNICLKLKRENKGAGKATCYAIDTDEQLNLELPSIVNGTDVLQVLVFPITVSFATKCPIIVIKDASENASETQETKAEFSKVLQAKDFTQADQDKLNDELKTLSNGMVVKSETKSTMKHKERAIEWPWHIRCGICHNEQLLEAGRGTEGRLKNSMQPIINTVRSSMTKKRKNAQSNLKLTYS